MGLTLFGEGGSVEARNTQNRMHIQRHAVLLRGVFAFLSFGQQLFDQLVQFGKVRFAHVAFDDLAALVHQVAGGRELDIAPSVGYGSGVVDGDGEGQLAQS